jgi:AraC-like DNA-binding protein/mannose-6-phosphate isomerase-like protein (cupin superfamily)
MGVYFYMEKNFLQTTVKELEKFLAAYHKATGETPSMSEALELMSRNDMLLPAMEEASLAEVLTRSADEIRDIIDSQPINASAYLHNADTGDESPAAEESAIFPDGRDVVAYRLFPYIEEKPRRHSFFEIMIVLDGKCTITFEDTPVELSRGDLVIIPPQSEHVISIPADSYVFSVDMRRSTFDAQFGSLMTNTDMMSIFFRDSLYGRGETNYLRISADISDRQLLATLYSVVRESCSEEPLANLCAMSWLKLFLAYAYRTNSGKLSVLRIVRNENTRADCGTILQYIQQNYRTVKLSTLARTFNYNETYLSRMLQANLGQSFSDIVRGIKMTRADDYLANSNLRVHEIATLVGYDSVDHFSRTFKNTHKMSPQAFRRIAVQKKNESAAAAKAAKASKKTKKGKEAKDAKAKEE